MANEESGNDKRLVIQGQRGGVALYLDGPPSSWGSWRERPYALSWDLDEVESAEAYLRQVRTQQGASLGASVQNVTLVVYDYLARAPSPPPPEAGSPASGASALSPSPHSEAIPGPRTEGEESPRSHPQPPVARETGEAGEAGEEGDLPRREKPGTFVSREGSSARVAPNLFQKQAPGALTPRSWGTHDFPVASRRK